MRLMSVALMGCLLAVTGCGSDGPPKVHPVSGQVLCGGKAAEGVKVYLFPVSAPAVPQIPANPRGVTGADGRFSITTFQENDGAPEGGYLVVLIWPDKSTQDEEMQRDKLFGWYDAAHTKLNVQVNAGNNDLPPFHVKATTGPPPESQGVPGRN